MHPAKPRPILYPAIDLKDGQCVRLRQGEMTQATVFAEDPVAQALSFEQAGAEYLHLVDLNGAFEGRSVNGESIRAILSQVKIPCQLGGGIRTHSQIEYWLGEGIARVILGSAASESPGLVKEAARAYPGRIVLGLDTRKEKIATEGWAKQSDISLFEMANQFADCGIGAIIHTDIDRDGMPIGLNFALSMELARRTDLPVIASGGCKSVEDIQALRETNLAGAIIGRALYSGAFTLPQALAALHA